MNQNNLTTNSNTELDKDNFKINIDTELLESLTPNTYLASLGITAEQRENNLIQLACAFISPADTSNDFKTQIPFMVTKGPFIKEEFLTVNVDCKDINGKPVMNLSLAKEPDEPELPGF